MRDDDELLRGYLLGKLDEEERSRLEERLIREEELFEAAEAVEADLLDDYVHDRLAPEERKQIALHLASSPRGRSRLALNRGLDRIANGNILLFRLKRVMARPEIRAAAAIAAMLVIVVNVLGLIPVSPVPLPPEPEIFHQAWKPPVPTDWITVAEPVEEIRIATEPTPSLKPAVRLVIQLALGTLRGEGLIPEANVPLETELVQLHLQLEETEKDYYSSFQASVRGAGPEFQAAGLKPRKINGRWTLVVDLDPGKLPEGLYEIEVLGVTASDELEPFAYKELEITRNDLATADTPD